MLSPVNNSSAITYRDFDLRLLCFPDELWGIAIQSRALIKPCRSQSNCISGGAIPREGLALRRFVSNIFFLVGQCRRIFFGAEIMKDAYEVLRLKENEMSRVEVEVEALRVVALLLSDDEETGHNSPATTGSTVSSQPIPVPEAANSNPQPEHSPEWRSKSWARS